MEIDNNSNSLVDSVENIFDDKNQLIAMIVRSSFQKPGVNFVTPNDSAQQVGLLRHPKGKVIKPHVHNRVARKIELTQEVLFLRAGKLRVDFYNAEQLYLGSKVLNAGDTVLLMKGGHGFEALEEVDIIEIKQGPYLEATDKILFPPIAASELRMLP